MAKPIDPIAEGQCFPDDCHEEYQMYLASLERDGTSRPEPRDLAPRVVPYSLAAEDLLGGEPCPECGGETGKAKYCEGCLDSLPF